MKWKYALIIAAVLFSILAIPARADHGEQPYHSRCKYPKPGTLNPSAPTSDIKIPIVDAIFSSRSCEVEQRRGILGRIVHLGRWRKISLVEKAELKEKQ